MKKISALIVPLMIVSGASAQMSVAPEIEPLIGHMLSPQGIHIQVKSAGCTAKEDFFVSQKSEGKSHSLSFYRAKMDLCRAHLPYGKVFTFSYAELGIEESDVILISNPDAGVTILE